MTRQIRYNGKTVTAASPKPARLRRRVMQWAAEAHRLHALGVTDADTAKRFGCSASYVAKLMKKYPRSGATDVE